MHYQGPIIDAHHHLWALSPGSHPWLEAPDRVALAHTVLPDAYRQTFARFSISASVYIEALASDPEAEIRQAETWRQESNGRICSAIIGHAPLDAPDITSRLDRQMALSPAFRGVRDIAAARPGTPGFARAPDLLARPAFLQGLKALAARKLVFELMVMPEQLEISAALLAEVPDLAVAIEHAGNPCDRSPAGMARWRAGMARLAALPNAIVKVSALQVLDPDWTLESLRSVFDPIVTLFGPERMCIGTDFPVHDLTCPGPIALNAFLDLTAGWSASDQDSLFLSTARHFYRIPS